MFRYLVKTMSCVCYYLYTVYVDCCCVSSEIFPLYYCVIVDQFSTICMSFIENYHSKYIIKKNNYSGLNRCNCLSVL